MRAYIGLFSIALLAGCTGPPDGPNTTRRLATIEFYGDTAHFTVPTTAQLNSPFVVTFRAYGGGCISDAQNEMVTSSSKTEIYSYQEIPTAGALCTAEIRIETVSISVTFTSLGVGHVVLHGQRQPGDVPITIDRAVNVGIF